MRKALFCFVSVVVCVAQVARADSLGARSDASNPDPQNQHAPSAEVTRIATRQTSFTIPFTVDATQVQPTSIQLFVSADQGANWVLYSRQSPSAKGFPFRASRDGEYWFSLKTVDANGVTRPTGQAKPSLQVIVDTQPPRVDFRVSVGNNGEVTGQWQAFDKNLVVDQLRIEYQPVLHAAERSEPWQPVDFEVPQGGAARNTLTGQQTWWPKTQATMINVRAVARDSAGNVEVVNRRVVLPKVAARPADNRAADSNGFVPTDDPFTRGRRGVQWPPDDDSPNPSVAGQPKIPAANRFADLGRQQPAHGEQSAPIADRVSTELRRSKPEPAGETPVGITPRITRARSFSLRYGVDTFDQDQVAKVELWATQDAGRTWQNWGTDTDRQSPFPVVVQADGVYGFKVVVTTSCGISGKPPRDGEAADIWIGVDTIKPEASITSVPLSNNGTQLLVNWQVRDRHLSERPITLSFAETPNGPWTTLAAGLPNTGQYVWTIDPRVPPQIYLRLEARDEAGNVTTDQLARPIRLDAMVPKGRILGFEPLDDN